MGTPTPHQQLDTDVSARGIAAQPLHSALHAARKVPEITIFFWIIKLLTTGMGETTSDYLVFNINPWRARLSQTCHSGRVKKKARSERWHTCPCGASAQRDLFSAWLARFVDPDTSLLDVGQAQTAWPGWEPTLQAAYEQAINNQPARGRRLPAAFGRPPGVGPSQSGSLAEGSPSRT